MTGIDLKKKPKTMEVQFCLECEKILRGRSDKRFCDQKCKNNYYNEFRRAKQPFQFRQINRILIHNRNILRELFENNKTRILKKEICLEGYLHSYFTHVIIGQEKTDSFFCYDYGIREESEDYYVVLKSNERRNESRSDYH